MNMKALFVVLLSLGISFAGLSVTGWTLSQDSYRPGANGVMTLDIANPLVSVAEVRTVEGIDLEATAPPQIIMAGELFVGDLEPGGSTKVSLPFKVSPNASSSIYSVELKITGVADRPSGTGGFDTFSRRIIIPVTVVNQPILSMRTDRQLIGGIDPMNLTIVNNGGRASNIKIRIADDAGASAETPKIGFYGVDQLFISSVESGKNATISLTLDSRGAADGAVDMPLAIEYEDELGIINAETTSIRLTIRNEKLDLKFVQISDIVTKTQDNLTMSITNVGQTALSDVRLSFSDTSLRLKDSGELKFGDLMPNQTATASAEVFADFPPGVNLISSKLTWIEKDVQKEESRDIPISITSDADVGVYLEAKPLPLTIGSEHTISVLVSNLGSYRIDNVDVSIDSPGMRSLDISDRQYIGSLQNDDFSTVQFLMEMNASSEGSQPVRITINYRDQSGEWKQKVINQAVSVYNTPVSDSSPLPVLGGLALLAAAVWFFFLRNRGQKG